VLLMGLAAGGGLTWLMNQLRPVFQSARRLAEVTGLQVLAAVSRTFEDRHRVERKRELLRFSTATGALVVAFGLIYLIETPGLSILQRLSG
jgi:hypothetical protein